MIATNINIIPLKYIVLPKCVKFPAHNNNIDNTNNNDNKIRSSSNISPSSLPYSINFISLTI